MSTRNWAAEFRSAMALALVPIFIGITFGVLLLPRKATPDIVPLPMPDVRGIARTVAADKALTAPSSKRALTAPSSERALTAPLPGAIRALGSAVREFHELEARDATARELGDARRAVDAAVVKALDGSDGELAGEGAEAGLLSLRAVQLEEFVREVRRFESGGEESPELQALGGAFVRSMRAEGWCQGHALAVPEDALRPMFKEMWNAFLGLDKRPALALTIDEERALYAFFLQHPHPSKSMRQALESARQGARDAKACTAIAEAERSATEAWRLEQIQRLGAIDPSYPTDFARGISLYRKADFGASAEAFRRWLRDHPEGAYTIRAENFLRAAVEADRIE